MNQIIYNLIKVLANCHSNTGGKNNSKELDDQTKELCKKLIQEGNFKSVEAILRGIIPNDNKSHSAYGLLGAACGMQGKLDQMKTYSQKAIDLNNNYPMAHNNLGYALEREGFTKEAITHFKKALELEPRYVECHVNLALALLKSGDYISGWQHYEWRLHSKQYKELKTKQNCPQFNGRDLVGEQLVIMYEQGLGDILQGMRFISSLKLYGASCSFCAPSKLHSLIKASNIDPSPLTLEEANRISTGHWMPLFSIPYYLSFGPHNPGVNQPYIHSSLELTKKWERLLKKEKKFTIGINWEGNRPGKDKSGRNIPVEYFNQIADIRQVQLLSVQRGAPETPTWVDNQLLDIQKKN